ncbi:cupin domain-containing protein [Patulibacter sp.]|uniref:cupin domain-containing protein n=1 Tax=Patulibacter sp. TaxID=1912859 RepID=UPI00271C59F5|nr:cupin domain-containing protein [Patulibacter sp.]MDO9407028.1 cupin domain-containing protein [Patulibacter sp.]
MDAPAIVLPETMEWVTRPHAPGEPARHVAELTERTGTVHGGHNVWRYEPGARGRRHVHDRQEETFLVVRGTLSTYLGDDAVRHDVPTGGVVHVPPGVAQQTVNHGDEDLVVYAWGAPQDDGAEVLATPAPSAGR